MKSTLKLILSAFLGSSLTLGTIWFVDSKDKNDTDKVKIEYINKTPVSGVTFDSDNAVLPGFDFSAVAKEVTPSVVHIMSTISTQSNVYQDRQLPDPFRDFFNDPFYRRFFGPDNRNNQDQDQNDDQGQDQGRYQQRASGSGVIINEKGYIVTNNHMIDNADEIEVTLYDRESYPATVIGTDPTTDLALIKIDAENLDPLPLVNSDDVNVGEWVLAVGNPFNLTSTVTAGIVSAKARNINILRDRYAIESFIQTDAAINPGNSGGALVNLDGGLVGINTAIASNTGSYAGYGFAVPSNIVSKIVEDLLNYGSVQRGVLGVTIHNVDGKLAKERGLDRSNGVFVDSVADNSAAKKAGIQPGDIITKVDDAETNSSPELQELIGMHRPGDKVKVLVDRDGKSKEFMVTLKSFDGKEMITRTKYNSTLMSLGADFQKIDKQTAKDLDIKGGVEITHLYPGALKRDTRIQEGFIILKVDKTEITSLDDLTKAIEGRQGGVLLDGIYKNNPKEHYYYALGLDM